LSNAAHCSTAKFELACVRTPDECDVSAESHRRPIIHLAPNPFGAKRFIEPLVQKFFDGGQTAVLWVEARTSYRQSLDDLTCPKRVIPFAVGVNPFRLVLDFVPLLVAWLLRQVLYRHVPRALIERPKMGFSAPLGRCLRGPLRNWAEAPLNESRLTNDGYLNPVEVRRARAEHISGRRNWEYGLWNVLMFQAWREIFH
jgi:hypothetical protein